MAQTFAKHGAEVVDNFDLHMIQICKPQKAAKSLSKNLERSVLMPKFVMTFSSEDMTQVRFMYYSRETVSRLVDDEEFPESVTASYAEIISLIEEAL